MSESICGPVIGGSGYGPGAGVADTPTPQTDARKRRDSAVPPVPEDEKNRDKLSKWIDSTLPGGSP